MWSDGRTTTDGWWQGFLAYVQHPRVEPYLEPYDLVSSEEPAAYYLLLDLVERQAYIGTARQVTRFLHDYTPRPDLTPEQGEMLTQVMRERPFTINHEAMERELEFRSLALQAMLEELESHFWCRFWPPLRHHPHTAIILIIRRIPISSRDMWKVLWNGKSRLKYWYKNMRYLLVGGAGPPLFIHSRCEDILLARAELLLFAEDAAQAYPGRPVVGSYDVEPGISIGDLKRAYRYDRKGYERLQQHRLRILQEGWPYPEWG